MARQFVMNSSYLRTHYRNFMNYFLSNTENIRCLTRSHRTNVNFASEGVAAFKSQIVQ